MPKSMRLKSIISILFLISAVAAVPSPAGADTIFGIGYLTRSFSSGEEDTVYKLKTLMLSTGQSFDFSSGWKLKLEAGFALSNFNGLAFNGLPVSLEYSAGGMPGVALGASIGKAFWLLDEFVIELQGRVRSSLSLKKNWTLEGFAVPGNASGTNWWAEASVGPKISYHFFGKFVPYLSIAGSYFTGAFNMKEKLENLKASEKKTFKGKSFLEVIFGSELIVSQKLQFVAEAGFRPYKGGLDTILTVATLIEF